MMEILLSLVVSSLVMIGVAGASVGWRRKRAEQDAHDVRRAQQVAQLVLDIERTIEGVRR